MGTRAEFTSISRRPAFTLVELLVVIVILLVLASLVVAFAPRLAERQKVSRGAELLQQHLLTAKQRAKKDRLPTGLRLFVDGTNQVRELQYIQKPDDYSRGRVSVAPGTLNQVDGLTANFFGGYSNSPAEQPLWPVQPGDYIEFKGGGLVHRIRQNPPVPPPVTNNRLLLESAVPYEIKATVDYRIIRKPRVLTGEPAIEMPKDVAVDLNWDTTAGRGFSAVLSPAAGPLTGDASGAIDILFSPSGEVIGGAAAKTAICLWVRDVSQDPFADPPTNDQPLGEPTLIVIYPKSGFIAAHPVNWNHLDYYQFARDGRSSGL